LTHATLRRRVGVITRLSGRWSIRRSSRIAVVSIPWRSRTSAYVFVPGQFSITVFIQRQQLGARIGNLVGINDPIVIHIQRPHNGWQRRMMPAAPKTRATLVRTTGRRCVCAVILGTGRQRGRANRHYRQYHFYFCFHIKPFIFGVKFYGLSLSGPALSRG
jgi:hypothetical protein